MIGRTALIAASVSLAVLAAACSSDPAGLPRAAGGWQTAGHRDSAALGVASAGPEGTAGTAAPEPTPSVSVGPRGAIVTGCEPSSHASCIGATIIAVDWSGSDLTAIDLTGATLLNVDLSRASLLRARLSGATIMNVDFTDANLRGADLSGATIVNSRLEVAFTGARTTCPDGQAGPCR